MITGSFPPDICGVGDYTSCFMSSHDTGIENWSLYYSKEWSLKLLKKKISVLNSYNTYFYSILLKDTAGVYYHRLYAFIILYSLIKSLLLFYMSFLKEV